MTPDLADAATAWWAWAVPGAVQAAALAAVVVAADLLLRGRASPRLRSALWWVVVLRLLTPPTLAAPWSLGSLGPGVLAQAGGGIPVPAPAAPALLFLLWIVGVLIVAAWTAASSVRTRRRLLVPARAVTAPAALLRALESAARRAGLPRAPRLLFTGAVPGPAVLGILRPVLLFPAEFRGTEEEADHALLHECLHLRRRDALAAAALRALAALWWFHPAAWVAERRIAALREACCDTDAAALLGEGAARYRGTLLAAARRRLDRAPSPGVLALLGDRDGLADRIRALEDRPWSRRGRSRAGATTAAVLLAVLALPMAPAGGRVPPPETAPSVAGGRRSGAPSPEVAAHARRLLEGAARGERESCLGLRWAALAVAVDEGTMPAR